MASLVAFGSTVPFEFLFRDSNDNLRTPNPAITARVVDQFGNLVQDNVGITVEEIASTNAPGLFQILLDITLANGYAENRVFYLYIEADFGGGDVVVEWRAFVVRGHAEEESTLRIMQPGDAANR